MKRLMSDTAVIDYGDYVSEFFATFPDTPVELTDYGYDYDCDHHRFHDYSLTVAKRDATPEMLAWAKDRDLLGNCGHGLDDDASDDDAAIVFTVQADGDGDLWIE